MKGISSYKRHNTTGDGLILNPRGQINEKINSIQEVGLKKITSLFMVKFLWVYQRKLRNFICSNNRRMMNQKRKG
jgi:hypothetical protein